MSQYNWVIKNLEKNLDSRKGFININQPIHKKLSSKDFPCTIGLQFFVRENQLHHVISSRSTDIFTGLPYDMAFFSFLTELVYANLKQKLPTNEGSRLKLGPTTMKTTFTQIYDQTREKALEMLKKKLHNQTIKTRILMPHIDDAQETLKDIYAGTQNTSVVKWLNKHAKLQ
jgi:thymidylate synthase